MHKPAIAPVKTRHPGAAPPLRPISRIVAGTEAVLGNQAVLRKLSTPLRLQAKLEIGAVDDPLEYEADRTADRVMAMKGTSPANPPLATPGVGASLRRACAACEAEEDKQLRAAPAGAEHAMLTGMQAPPIVDDVLRSPGRPLDHASRAFFEPRFGYDFSNVRIHDDRTAQQSAQSVRALAYTAGRDLVFAAGQYRPNSVPGQRLLAHELAHVVQQGESRGSPARLSRQAHCGGTWVCSSGAACAQPDAPGNGTPSTTWQLDLNIDTDVDEAEDITGGADVGHTYVLFSESNGAKYSYGFYPRPERKPDEFHTKVFGCFVHPDTTHTSCVDYTKSYKLTQAQYNDALQFAQLMCQGPDNYDLFNFNCTTAAVAIAKKAGLSPPSPTGKVAHGVTTADNPNTLKAGYLDQDVPTRHLTSDTEIRDWAAAHPASAITPLPVTEKIRLLNRLLDGWVSDDDVSAFEKICTGIGGMTERSTIQASVGKREDELNNSAQKARVHTALFGANTTPAPAPGVFAPNPPPPR